MRMQFLLSGLIISLAACATPATSHQYADPVSIDETHPPAIREVAFDSHGARLNGIVYLANGAGPHPTVILLHGFPGNEKNLDIAQALRRDGFNVLFFHYRGAWGSQGAFSFTHVIEDVASAADMLRANAEVYRVDTDHITLIGHSMGGFAALHGAARDAGVSCVAGIAAADFGAIGQVFAANPEASAGFAAYGDTLDMLAGFSGPLGVGEIVANRDAFDVRVLAPQLVGKSVLLVAADRDEAVSPDVFHDPMVAAFAAEPDIDLTATTLPGDHSFSWSRIALTQTVLEWADGCR